MHGSQKRMNERHRSEVPWRVRDVVFVFLLTLFIGAGASLLVSIAVEAGSLEAKVATALLMPLSPILLGGVCLAYVAVRYPRTTSRLFGATATPMRELGIGLMVGFAAMVLQIALLAVASGVLEIPVDEAQAPLREAARDPQLRPFLFVGAVLLAPLAEELFFRGLAYQVLRRRARVTGGAILSAAFFAVAHLSAGVPLSATLVLLTIIFLLGVLLALLFERRGSLLAPIAVHATFNLLGLGALLSQGQ